MTINVNPERSTLSLPGVRLRSEEPTLRAGPDGVLTSAQNRAERATPSVTVARSAVADAGALRAATSSLDRASSITDTAVAGASRVVELLTQLRDAAAGERGDEFKALVRQVEDTARSAGFDGVNLLDGSTPGGMLRLSPDASGGSDILVGAPDLRPNGARVTVSADADPLASLGAVETSLVNTEEARDELREDSKRLGAHRAFVGLLSDAVAGGGASLDVEGARLAALSIKQALAGTTLSLGVGGPTTVLALFR